MPRSGDALWLRLQPVSYWLVIGVLSLLLPAAAIVIALEDKFFKALNPLNVLHLVQTMGSAYFVLWGFFLAIAGTRQVVLGAGTKWPAAVSFPLEMAVATYLALVLFAVMGYALYQFHQELHLDVEVDFDEHRQAGGAEGIARAGSARAALNEAAPKDPLERKLQPLLAQGNITEAIAEVKDYMRYDRLDPALNKRLHGLYLRQADNALTLGHGQQLVSALARAGQGREALAALKTLLAIDPAFLPDDADVVLPTATAALQAGDVALAANLLRNFDKRFPAAQGHAGRLLPGGEAAQRAQPPARQGGADPAQLCWRASRTMRWPRRPRPTWTCWRLCWPSRRRRAEGPSAADIIDRLSGCSSVG